MEAQDGRSLFLVLINLSFLIAHFENYAFGGKSITKNGRQTIKNGKQKTEDQKQKAKDQQRKAKEKIWWPSQASILLIYEKPRTFHI